LFQNHPNSAQIRFLLPSAGGLSGVELASGTMEKIAAGTLFEFHPPTGNRCAPPEKATRSDGPTVQGRNPELVKDALWESGRPRLEMVGSVDDEHADAG